jgi:hypothetical protein
MGEHGAIAQMGERLHGMQEVGGSIPPGSTKLSYNNNVLYLYLISEMSSPFEMVLPMTHRH